MTKNQKSFSILVHLGKYKASALARVVCLHCGTAKLPTWQMVMESTPCCLGFSAAQGACPQGQPMLHLYLRHGQALLGDRRVHKTGVVDKVCFNVLSKN